MFLPKVNVSPQYKLKFSHLDFYYDIGKIINKSKVEVNDDYISHTVKELIELRAILNKAINKSDFNCFSLKLVPALLRKYNVMIYILYNGIIIHEKQSIIICEICL